jgi:ribosomal protein L11 methylase PrmA
MKDMPRYILAPHAPTAEDVVERMVSLAAVEASDFVLDIGCGDGRLAIAAARLRGARALGVDIEACWVEEARNAAAAAGVSHLARFEQRDALSVDWRPATVVFLYLVEWSTLLVAQHIREHCRPGTRVVSNGFPFAATAGARTETLEDASGRPRSLHLWIVPEAETGSGPRHGG